MLSAHLTLFPIRIVLQNNRKKHKSRSGEFSPYHSFSMLLVLSLLLICIFPISIALSGPTVPELTVVARTSAGSVNGFNVRPNTFLINWRSSVSQVDYGSDRSQLYYGRASIFLGVPFAHAPLGERRFKVRIKYYCITKHKNFHFASVICNIPGVYSCGLKSKDTISKNNSSCPSRCATLTERWAVRCTSGFFLSLTSFFDY